ncbi:uncharacterized protein EAF01_009974 [Botrytis porri]|uniref:DUF7726 domain-containing protein n=1 Tax=Botrytis porri TaxID=87229 RepID=A0A4Z1L300_9HELO|nr:uncharacterized protein EAF01_009974 [Botrytis porri]KAF7894523.1 hypothetical protein EAF01_009974 [Botrytis porri]TGO91057.1 hypothetical protein BPOR_0040g00010 [Botrytis porri]
MPRSENPLAKATPSASTPSEDRVSTLPVIEENKAKDDDTAIDFKKYDHLIDMELERCRLSHELCKEWMSLGVSSISREAFFMYMDRTKAPDYIVLRRELQNFIEFALEEQKISSQRGSIVPRNPEKEVPGNKTLAVVKVGSSSQSSERLPISKNAQTQDNRSIDNVDVDEEIVSKSGSQAAGKSSNGRATDSRRNRAEHNENAVIEPENTSTIVSTSKSNSQPTTKSVLTDQETKRCREKLRSILMADDDGFGKEENKCTPSAVQFELQFYRNGFIGFGYKLCDLIGVSQKDFDEFMVSAFGMSQKEGSQNEVCRRSWDLLRELEKERRDEASSNGKTKQTSSSGTKRAPGGEAEGVPKKKKRNIQNEDPMDLIASIGLDDDEDGVYGAIEVYDTCDSLREKIQVYLDETSVSQTAFCRAISKSLDDQKVTPSQLKFFMSRSGAKAGKTSLAFYAGYCFMEKVRLVEKKEKSAFRLEMENIWDGTQPFTYGRMGFDIWTPEDQTFFVSATSILEIDEYGVMYSVQ